MSEIKVKKENLDLKSRVHLLPCKIMYNGEGNVESYFESCIYQMENSTNDG